MQNVSKLQDLYSIFLEWSKQSSPEVFEKYNRYRIEKGINWDPQEISNVLIDTAKYVDAFIGMLFQIEDQQAVLKRSVERKPIFKFKKDFLQRRVWKKYKPTNLSDLNFEELQSSVHAFIDACQQSLYAKSHFNQYENDEELFVSTMVCWLLDIDKDIKSREMSSVENFNLSFRNNKQSAAIVFIRTSINIHQQEKSFVVQSVLDVFEKWSFARYFNEEKKKLKHWVSYRFPEPLDCMNLVKVLHPNDELHQEMIGPEEHLRRRDGFKLTDRKDTVKEKY